MRSFSAFLRKFLFAFIVKPFIYIVLGYNVEGYEYFPQKGPAILVANHNSHVDTLLLMSLFSNSLISKVHPAAAADYFCNGKIKSFIFKNLMGIIPLTRKVTRENKDNIFSGIYETLSKGEIIILYPEGTRGNDENIQNFKQGIAHIAKDNPNVPIIPVYMSGTEKILPKLELILVPFISDIYISEPMFWDNSTTKDFTQKIQEKIIAMKEIHKKNELL